MRVTTDLLLDKLVPVLVGKRARTDDDLVPVTAEVVISRVLGDPHAVKLQTAGDLLLRLKYHERHLQMITMIR